MGSSDDMSDEIPDKDTDEEIVVAPPKKRAKKVEKENQPSKNDKGEQKKKRRKAGKVFKDDFNPTTQEMIKEAIKDLNESNGSSVLAIRNYIFDHFKVNESRFKVMMKRALTSLSKENKIGRPKAQEEIKGILVGRYVLMKEEAPAKEPPRARPSSLRGTAVLNRINRKEKVAKPKKKKRRKHY